MIFVYVHNFIMTLVTIRLQNLIAQEHWKLERQPSFIITTSTVIFFVPWHASVYANTKWLLRMQIS